MPSIFKHLLTIFITLTTSLCYGQNENLSRIQEITFLGKIKFANVFVAGEERENIQACNGKKCGVSGRKIMSDIQKLNYKKAKVLTVGYCEIEMLIDSNNLKKYQIVTKRAKETDRLVQEIFRQFGATEMKTEIATWTTKSLNGETITSQLTISTDKETANFKSWVN